MAIFAIEMSCLEIGFVQFYFWADFLDKLSFLISMCEPYAYPILFFYFTLNPFFRQRFINRVSAKLKFRYISHQYAASPLVFLGRFYMVIIDQISQKQLPTCSNGLEKITW